MLIKGIIDEDFSNFKKPSMFIAFNSCTFKCGRAECQNSELALSPDIYVTKEEICERYLKNNISEAFVFGGLEPFDQLIDLISLVDCIRNKYNINDDIVIYTGYTEKELLEGRMSKDIEIGRQNYNFLIKNYKNLIIKFGRYLPNQEPHFDEVLGVNLISNNQYAVEFNREDG